MSSPVYVVDHEHGTGSGDAGVLRRCHQLMSYFHRSTLSVVGANERRLPFPRSDGPRRVRDVEHPRRRVPGVLPGKQDDLERRTAVVGPPVPTGRVSLVGEMPGHLPNHPHAHRAGRGLREPSGTRDDGPWACVPAFWRAARGVRRRLRAACCSGAVCNPSTRSNTCRGRSSLASSASGASWSRSSSSA